MPLSHLCNRLLLSRIMYLLSALAWLLLLWPIPFTVILAACFACLTVPLYRKLRRYSRRRRYKLERRRAQMLVAAMQKNSGRGKKRPRSKYSFLPVGVRMLFSMRISFLNALPVGGTLLIILTATIVPVLAFVCMVTPQIASGFALVRQLWMDNFQLPDEMAAKLDALVEKLQSIPGMDSIASHLESYQDTLFNYLSNFSTDSLVALANQGFDLLGGASSVAMHMVLFLALSITFIIHAPRLRLTASRLFNINPLILHRFSVAIRQALRAIMLGVIFVAIIQGFLCAIGFAIVGIKQFAFCGLLAAILAPIPVFGTALVWVPLSLHLWFIDRPMAAVVLLVWSVGIVSSADSFLRPLFLKTGIKASFLVLILVIFCGITAFGSAGIILGPVLLAISIQALEEGNIAYPSFFKGIAVEKNASPSQSGSQEQS